MTSPPWGSGPKPEGWDEYQERKASRLAATAAAMLANAEREADPSEVAKKHARSRALNRRMRWVR
jgi:hypothetical protein